MDLRSEREFRTHRTLQCFPAIIWERSDWRDIPHRHRATPNLAQEQHYPEQHEPRWAKDDERGHVQDVAPRRQAGELGFYESEIVRNRGEVGAR